MKRLLIASAIGLSSGLIGCGDHASITEVTATQLTVRTHASNAIQRTWQTFSVRVDGEVKFSASYTDTLTWPIDIQLVASEPSREPAPVELVVRVLDDEGTLLAEDRSVTGYVSQAARQIELYLDPCGERPVCELDPECVGSGCLRCVDGACQRTGVTLAEDLAPLNPTPAPDTVPSCDDELTCDGNRVMACHRGRLSELEQCEFVCRDGACSGECSPERDAPRCDPESPGIPQVCGEHGVWGLNEAAAERDGRCRYVCSEGACVGSCAPDSQRCEQRREVVCDELGVPRAGKACDAYCGDAACAEPPSCTRDMRCGSRNASCCSSLEVPGGAFYRGNDGVDATTAYPATVSPFLLEEFEVTVGRFRRWVEAFGRGSGRPVAGSGKNTKDVADGGWSAAFDASLPATRAELEKQLGSCEGSTWTASGVDDALEKQPINCVSWYVAQAFCIWDGGRLPTEAEWSFAASGGDEQRYFPWSEPPSSRTLDASLARYASSAPSPVGSTAGSGRWGQRDLVGNVGEWVLDTFDWEYPMPCDDCSRSVVTGAMAVLGGDFTRDAEILGSIARLPYPPEEISATTGFRCIH